MSVNHPKKETLEILRKSIVKPRKFNPKRGFIKRENVKVLEGFFEGDQFTVFLNEGYPQPFIPSVVGFVEGINGDSVIFLKFKLSSIGSVILTLATVISVFLAFDFIYSNPNNKYLLITLLIYISTISISFLNFNMQYERCKDAIKNLFINN